MASELKDKIDFINNELKAVLKAVDKSVHGVNAVLTAHENDVFAVQICWYRGIDPKNMLPMYHYKNVNVLGDSKAAMVLDVIKAVV